MADVRVFPTPTALTQAAAEFVLTSAEEAVRERGRFVWGLSGGSTPEALYRKLAEPPYSTSVPWRATFVFWGDERWVPHDHPESNQRMANEALLSHSPPQRRAPSPYQPRTRPLTSLLRPSRSRCAAHSGALRCA